MPLDSRRDAQQIQKIYEITVKRKILIHSLMLLFSLLFKSLYSYIEYFYAELLSGIGKEVEAGRLPSNLAAGMEELYHNYKNAVNIYT